MLGRRLELSERSNEEGMGVKGRRGERSCRWDSPGVTGSSRSTAAPTPTHPHPRFFSLHFLSLGF